MKGPNDSVAEFYFDSEGIHFIKGSTAVVLKKNNEQNNNGQDAPLEGLTILWIYRRRQQNKKYRRSII